MDFFSEQIWHRFRRTLAGRFVVVALMSGATGALAAAEISPTGLAVTLSALGAALIGILAVWILELRDRRRTQTVEWQKSIAHKTSLIRKHFPQIPPEQASTMAQSVEENRLTPLVWIGITLGALCLFGGAVGVLIHIIQFFREK